MTTLRGGVEAGMDAVVNQLARELSEAISAAVAADPKVEAVREKARVAGYEMRVSLEAAIGFGPTLVKPAATAAGAAGATRTPASSRKATPRQPLDMTANDRRFLKSLRIAADETLSKEAD
jgi:hypothetical protein